MSADFIDELEKQRSETIVAPNGIYFVDGAKSVYIIIRPRLSCSAFGSLSKRDTLIGKYLI